MRRLIRALVRPGNDGLFSQVMSAGFWAGALRIILRIMLIARTVILARLLAPDDFGVMAVATLSMLFLERVSQSGISQALIQRRGDIRPYLNTAWTLQIVRGLAMAGLLVLAAPWISEFFRIPETLQVLRVVSISVNGGSQRPRRIGPVKTCLNNHRPSAVSAINANHASFTVCRTVRGGG